ncbi:MAG: molybdenum cofactor guanylyltransferase [Thermoleophilaceae bacterium]|jgi:molybdopterin-guanine dinucleotide biosynthesis protein A|nr:molybdenum cofactor guanylyltransferase [Thermoleophilaceae bacterium]
MGAPKAGAELAGRPLIGYPLAALAAVCERVVVVCKRGTDLPPIDAERWDEPDDPRHPVAGITHALERAGESILVCGADMPFVQPDVCALIAAELRPGMKAAVAFSEGRLQPLLAAYAPEALEVIRLVPAGEPLTRSVESLMPIPVDVDPEVVFNVNTPEDLAEAERRLRSGSSETRP